MTEEPKQKKDDDNIIFIGSKPFMSYVTSAVIQFTTRNQSEVIIKARGKFINKAVDVSEVTKKKLAEQKLSVKNIRINSEEFKSKEGRKINVSTIEITLSK